MEQISLNRPAMAPSPSQHQPPAPKRRFGRLGLGARTVRIELFIVLVGSALLLAAVSLYIAFSTNSGAGESKQVTTSEYQAVFLNNGQVYFGKLTTLNDKYVVMRNIFYIENSSASSTSGTQSANNYTLRKLGTTELHSPEDKMVINKSQVTFWENLKDSSQVVTKIQEYYKNPSSSSNSTNSQGQSTTSPQTSAPATNPTPATNTTAH